MSQSKVAPYSIVTERANSKTTLSSRDIFRQTRFLNENERVSIEIDGLSGSLKNWSRTGLGFEANEKQRVFELGEVIHGIKVHLGEVILFEGAVEVKVRRKASPEMTYYGVECKSSLFMTEGVRSAAVISDCASTLEEDALRIEKMDPEFSRTVLGLALSLRTLKKVCEEEEKRWKGLTFDQKREAEKIFLPNASEKVRGLFISFNIKLGNIIDVETLPAGSIYHKAFEELIYPYFEGADLVRRAFEKPRGYAGDYEMMNQIYRQGYEGDDLFGRVLHNYIANENSGYSVRFRKDYFYSYFSRYLDVPGEKRFLSIACGPAVEVQEVVKTWDQKDLDRVQFSLFDLDREALEHAQTRIWDLAVEYSKKPQIEFINASVKAFLASSQDSPLEFDLIYSGGLFDYLDNPTSAALVKKFFAMVKPGGRVVIGNFTKDNLTKAYLHLLTQWNLIHKTEEEIRLWAKDISNCEIDVEYDANRMNAFLVVRKRE